MMGRSVIVAYKPKVGKDRELLAAVGRHLDVLRGQGLATARPGHLMRAGDGTVIEVFEWRSADAIDQAHSNPAVQALWRELGEVCEYVPLATVAEARQPFAEFDSLPLD